MSVKCIKCGIETNDLSGVCAPCRVKGMVAERLAQNNTPPLPHSGEEGDGGKDMKERDYVSHRKCDVDDCIKYVVKDRLCTTHYKEKHGSPPYQKIAVGDGKRVYMKKEAKVLPPPEVAVRRIAHSAKTKDAGRCNCDNPRVDNIIQKLIDKRNQIDDTLRAISELTGVKIA